MFDHIEWNCAGTAKEQDEPSCQFILVVNLKWEVLEKIHRYTIKSLYIAIKDSEINQSHL